MDPEEVDDLLQAYGQSAAAADSGGGGGGGDESLSSTDAEHERRRRRRMQRQARRNATASGTAHATLEQTAPAALHREVGGPASRLLEAGAAAAAPTEPGLVIAPIRKLVDDFPSLHTTVARKGMVGDADDPHHNPFAVEACVQALRALPRPEYALFPLARPIDASGRPDSDDSRLVNVPPEVRRVDLPMLTADYEARLLGQSGTFPWTDARGRVLRVTYPPCALGNNCVGRRGGSMLNHLRVSDTLMGFPPSHPGVTLTALVFPDEWDHEGQPRPSEPRPCILCYRILLADCVYQLRWASATGPGAVPVVQLYANPVDREGGYVKDFMLMPHAPLSDCIIEPIAEFRFLHLRAEYDGPLRRGGWSINQTDTVYHPPVHRATAPPVGENLSLF